MARNLEPEGDALVAFLKTCGAARAPHGGGRTLLDHLVGTCHIVRCWGQPVWLQHAALIHSVYGTEAYQQQLISLARRESVSAVAGVRAERLAYLFHVVPRGPLLAGTHRWARELPLRPGASDDDPPSRDELDALVVLHMANIADQASAADGSPGRWLARIAELGELLVDSSSVYPPMFVAWLAGFGESEETLTRRTYTEGLRGGGETRTSALALAAALCPVVAEPCVWLAYAYQRMGDNSSARAWAAQARRRFAALGTAWDKRLEIDEWLAVVDALDSSAGEDPGPAPETVTHPRALFDAVAAGRPRGRAAVRAADPRAVVPPDAETGRKRFHRYVEGLADTAGARPGAVYGDLLSRPWYDPRDFPLVGYLEANFAAIRDELLALSCFHRESERIGRTGDWDVAFLYERGRRHDRECAACPVTARGIESHRTIRTLAGLIYVSRMRPGTHIEAHRGPTNLRVRCHLGVKVPEGDCAIRVADETRSWQEGKCMVFDDFYEHEAWNHTGADRIVLIVDLWHPGLSDTEVMLLEALHRYTSVHAERLSRYWSANARAAGEAARPAGEAD